MTVRAHLCEATGAVQPAGTRSRSQTYSSNTPMCQGGVATLAALIEEERAGRTEANASWPSRRTYGECCKIISEAPGGQGAGLAGPLSSRPAVICAPSGVSSHAIPAKARSTEV